MEAVYERVNCIVYIRLEYVGATEIGIRTLKWIKMHKMTLKMVRQGLKLTS
jgi:hypothetical protein